MDSEDWGLFRQIPSKRCSSLSGVYSATYSNVSLNFCRNWLSVRAPCMRHGGVGRARTFRLARQAILAVPADRLCLSINTMGRHWSNGHNDGWDHWHCENWPGSICRNANVGSAGHLFDFSWLLDLGLLHSRVTFPAVTFCKFVFSK